MDFSDDQRTFIQKVYPTVNNEDLLEFRIPPNVKANLCLSNVMLRFMVKIPQTSGTIVIPENLLGAKQFSSLEIRINGDAVNRRNCSNEYFLASYFQNITNFSVDYACSSGISFGLFDTMQMIREDFTENSDIAHRVAEGRSGVNEDHVYEIVMPIDSSIFSCNGNLPTKTAIDISFERSNSKFSIITNKEVEGLPEILTLEDPFLLVPFTNDYKMHQYEQEAISRPIKLKYDDYVINRFNIPKDSPNARLSNVLSGPLPTKLFWGIMDLSSYAGSYDHSSSHFTRASLKKMTLYLDGNVVSGFPILTSENAVSIPYTRFLMNTNRYLNCYSCTTLSPRDFKHYHFLNSSTLAKDSAGSLTFDFDFEKTPNKDLVLITCGIFERTIEIDNFRNFKIT